MKTDLVSKCEEDAINTFAITSDAGEETSSLELSFKESDGKKKNVGDEKPSDVIAILIPPD